MVEHKKSYSYWERGHGTPYTYPTVGGDAWIYVGLILKLQIKSDVTITFLFFFETSITCKHNFFLTTLPSIHVLTITVYWFFLGYWSLFSIFWKKWTKSSVKCQKFKTYSIATEYIFILKKKWSNFQLNKVL